MGDRCSCTIWCRRQDVKVFLDHEETEFEETDVLPNGLVQIEDNDVNYAFDGMEPPGIPFILNHGSGGEYGPGVAVSDGSKTTCMEMSRCGSYFVSTDGNGVPDPGELQHLKDFIDLYNKIEKMLIETNIPEKK